MSVRAIPPDSLNGQTLLSLRLEAEPDVVVARQRTRDITAGLGLSPLDQVGLATAVSELSREILQHSNTARIEFVIDPSASPRFLWVQISDSSAESDLERRANSSVAAIRRLTDRFEVLPAAQGGSLRFGKRIPSLVTSDSLGRLRLDLANQPSAELRESWQQQNRDLVQTLETLRATETELESRRNDLERLSVELEETNRGVVALYAELEERAVALAKANELKSQVLSYVSHEFRTPVHGVLALTHILLRRIDGELTSEQERQVSLIRKAAEGLSEMVNDLLDLAKVEAGKTDIRTSTADLGQILGAVRALMRPLATNEAVTLTFEDPPPGLLVETDETKLGQILRNLVSNALKFTERGEVRVSVRVAPESDMLSFVVADTGIGIAPHHLDVIFQEFSQIGHSLQARHKGTGLGLPLSQKLARLLGGNITVSSEEGKGSTFVLSLPKRFSRPSAGTPNGTPVEQDDPCILVVDDDEPTRYLCRQLFRGTRYRVIEATELEAAERARFERPSLVILDLMMPDRSGFEVLDDLKNDASTASIPVIIHTSKSLTEGDRQRLGGRHIGLLPKSGKSRTEGLQLMRKALGDPALFADQPEFAGDQN